MYANGQVVAQDEAEAVRWYRLAAEQGDDYARIHLGEMYAEGKGVPQDDVEAVQWFWLATESSDHEARNLALIHLGHMYAEGRGVAQDDAKAARQFRRAAKQGDDYAQRTLGEMHQVGQGVPQNDAEALRWYALAAEQGNLEAQRALGVMCAAGRGAVQPADVVKLAGEIRSLRAWMIGGAGGLDSGRAVDAVVGSRRAHPPRLAPTATPRPPGVQPVPQRSSLPDCHRLRRAHRWPWRCASPRNAGACCRLHLLLPRRRPAQARLQETRA